MNIFATAKLGLIPEPKQTSRSGVRTPELGSPLSNTGGRLQRVYLGTGERIWDHLKQPCQALHSIKM